MKRVLFVVLLAGCRFGGPTSDDPNALPPHGDAASSDSTATSDDSSTIDDSSIESDSATVADSGEAGGSDTSSSAETAGEAGSCDPAFTSDTCDPVDNTGCGSGSRCDVDDGKTHAGRCVGLAALGEGAFCTKTSLTDTCGSKLTCVDNKCRKLCRCDANCGGRCCKFSVPGGGGASGFMACDDC